MSGRIISKSRGKYGNDQIKEIKTIINRNMAIGKGSLRIRGAYVLDVFGGELAKR